MRAYDKARNATPGRKAAKKTRRATPKYKAVAKARRNTPKHIAAHTERGARYYAKNREYVKAHHAEYARENRGKLNARDAMRKAREVRQICACCTPEERRAPYVWAAALGLCVDHTIALRLGGLHCCKNLNPMTVEDHKKKTKLDMALIAAIRRQEQVNGHKRGAKCK